MASNLLSHAAIAIALGLLVLLTAWLPLVVRRLALSLPIVAVALGIAMSYIPGTERYAGRLFRDALLEHLTEFVILIALMGRAAHRAAILMDEMERHFPPPHHRDAAHDWDDDSPLHALAGTAVGISASRRGRVGPSDPVLAADVQVGPPGEEEGSEVRFNLISAAGLNDGLAFPFVALAVGLTATSVESLWKDWLLIDVIWKIGCGGLVGYIAGRVFGWLTFKLPRLKLSKTGDGLVAVGVTLVSYGATELAHGYGFVAVFIAAMTLRATDRGHDFHSAMAEFSEQIERVLMVIVLVIFGGAIASGVLTALRWEDAIAGAAMLPLIRPITGWIALLSIPLPAAVRALIAFFGIRGLGTSYYMAYAMNRTSFDAAPRLWALASVVVLSSVVLHGVTATPVMNWVDRRRHTHRKEHRRPERQGGERNDQPAEDHAA